MVSKKTNEELIQIMIDSSPMSIQVWDKNANCLGCNKASLLMFGVRTQKEFINNFFNFSPSHQSNGMTSREAAVFYLSQANAFGKVTFEWDHINNAKKAFKVETILVKVEIEDSTIFAGYTRDLTAQNLMLARIKYRDRLLNAENQAAQTILNTSLDNFETNIEDAMKLIGKLTDADSMYFYQLEEKQEKVFGKKLFEWNKLENYKHSTYNEICLTSTTPYFLDALKNNKIINHLVRELPKLERSFLTPLEITAILQVPVFFEANLFGFIGLEYHTNETNFPSENVLFLQNISNLFVSSIKLHNWKNDLNSALVKATLASQAKSNFLSNMSHELRTPLNAIIGMAQISKKNHDLIDKNHALNKIADASLHLLNIVNDILDIAKIENNQVEVSYKEFNLAKTIQKVINKVSFRAEEKNQTINVQIDPNTPVKIISDEQLLSQILSNLFSNAIKFTPNNGNILINVNVINDHEQRINFQVIDNGIGISKAHQKRIFLAFEQGDKSINRLYGGTGLGLAIAKKFVEILGGKLSVTSKLNFGSTFSFYVINKLSDSQMSFDEPQNIVFEGKQILIVDDIDINREIVELMLLDSKIKIHTAENGKIAVDLINNNQDLYDLVFMDMQMPFMDGVTATKTIRNKLNIPKNKLPIIAMTANVSKEDISKCLAAGMNDHIGKPIDLDLLYSILNKYL